MNMSDIGDFKFLSNKDVYQDDGLAVDNARPPAINVVSPSGTTIPLLTELEVEVFNNKVEAYRRDLKFDNSSDLSELDRILVLELLSYRWGCWSLQGFVDYDGSPVNTDLGKQIREASKEIRDIKSGLGIDKKTRDTNKGGNAVNFVNNLLIRTSEFGIHRNEQVIKSYTNWKELQGLLTLHDNCTDSERSEFNCHIEDVIELIRGKILELDKIDEVFRKEKQRYWIRELS